MQQSNLGKEIEKRFLFFFKKGRYLMNYFLLHEFDYIISTIISSISISIITIELQFFF